MKISVLIMMLVLFLLGGVSPIAFADPPNTSDKDPAISTTPTAPYLLAGAPSFDMTIVQFREKYNQDNPQLQIGEFRAISTPAEDTPLLTRAASKLNEKLYASTALEKGTGKIKTLQITYLPGGNEEKAALALASRYMAALMHTFEPLLTQEQSLLRVDKLLEHGKGSRFYQQQSGALRYVIVDNGEKGLTFAVEPLKLSLSEP